MEETKSNQLLNQGSLLMLQQNQGEYQIRLEWEKIDQKSQADLDLQCVLMNEISEVTDVVFYNKLVSDCGAVKHSGDIQQGEKQGFDEELVINIAKLKYDIKFIAVLICSYEGQSFSSVESASVSIFENNQFKTSLSIGALGNSTSCLVCLFGKDYQNNWTVYNCSQGSFGKNFTECESLIKSNLKHVGFDEALLLESKNWNHGKSYHLQKDQVLFIPKSCYSKIKVGLGWNAGCDIDSSIILLTEQNEMYSNVYFGNKKSPDGSVVHSGDNLFGFGFGDDETIVINLEKTDPKVSSIWAVITVFSGNKQFDDVSGAYCRLLLDGKEFCRYNLSKNKDGVSNGNIMCCLKKFANNQWTVKALGYFTTGTQFSQQIFTIIQEVVQNNFTNIKILESSAVHQVAPKKIEQRQNSKNFTITIKSATNLLAFDSNGKSDPYCKLKLNSKRVFKTQIIKKTLDPIWNEKCTVALCPNDKIQFNLYDYDFMRSDDYMGSCFVTVTPELFNQPKTELTLQVLDRQEKPSTKYIGKLNIEIMEIN